MQSFLSFKLPDDFITPYTQRAINWGYNIGGDNSLAELTFISKYSRLKEDGTKERWHETCRRCIEGMYSILKDHCKANRTPWNEQKAQRSAQEAYERMFVFKWTPPGRGLQFMGTDYVHANQDSSSLQNCAAVSSERITNKSVYEATLPFVRMLEMSMIGIGVGFDTKGAGKLWIHGPTPQQETFVVPDSREGWAESLGKLLESYFFENRPTVVFDYSLVRPAGSILKTFQGTASGPEPLAFMHVKIAEILDKRRGQKICSTDIVDIMNLIGKAVVAGGARRTAQLALGSADDKEFLNLKNWEVNPERTGANGWAFASNNSVYAKVSEDYSHLVDNIIMNGEPGLIFNDLCREYGRLADPPTNRDYRATLCNPCAEQNLEPFELCCLVETYPIHHDTLADFKRTIKFAYLYGKAVTLMPTRWAESNEIMQRNRRIGCSVSGTAQFVELRGWTELQDWLNNGYAEVKRRDHSYSEWLGVRESIKMTSVKPSGTTSLVASVTPGVHWPVADIYIRRMRLSIYDPLLTILTEAGYHTEPDVMAPDTTVCVELPTRGPSIRVEHEVSVWEKAALAEMHQRYWADNQVSLTLTFRKDEENQIAPLMHAFNGKLKSMSFLPIIEAGGAYKQMPYERITEDKYEQLTKNVRRLNWDALYNGEVIKEAEGDKFCNNDKCEITI